MAQPALCVPELPIKAEYPRADQKWSQLSAGVLLMARTGIVAGMIGCASMKHIPRSQGVRCVAQRCGDGQCSWKRGKDASAEKTNTTFREKASLSTTGHFPGIPQPRAAPGVGVESQMGRHLVHRSNGKTRGKLLPCILMPTSFYLFSTQ